jgi:lipopolysaccharide/colanic/teichoic acid biosynthesis glycosyltransferase
MDKELTSRVPGKARPDRPARPSWVQVGPPPLRVVEPAQFPEVRQHPWPGPTQAAKGVLDKILAALALVVLTPLFAAVAILVKISSPGPVIYRQIRIGIDRRFESREAGPGAAVERRRLKLPGRPFVIYKFRTMVDGAENVLGPTWASAQDPRVTRVGKVLRMLRIDEMPQFLNVLKGDMSLVGPRPERPVFVNDLVDAIPGYAHRLRVKPGITGLAQVEHQYDSCLDDVRQKIQYDLYYIREHDFWLDLRILLKTVWVVLAGRGAR